MNHLTLEQCKKLKELGFPQDTYLRWFNTNPEQYFPKFRHSPILMNEAECKKTPALWPAGLACPTLEELIEWLGKDLVLLSHFYSTKKRERYYRAANHLSDLPGLKEAIAPTPLEAVYALAVATKS